MTMRTPLNKVRHLGPAGTGTGHFWLQRLTAITNIPLTIFVIWLFLSFSGASHAQVTATIKHPAIAFGLIAVVISFVWHMRLGMQVVIEDYTSGSTRLALIIANTLFCALIALMSIFAVVKISFGA